MRRHLLASLLVAGSSLPYVTGCAPRAAAPQTGASVSPAPERPAIPPAPSDEPKTELGTGVLPPVDHPEPIAARVAARYVDADLETLALEIVLPLPAAFNAIESAGTVVAIDGAAPYAFAALPDDVGVIEGRGVGAALVWVRRPRAQESSPVSGQLFTPQLDRDPGHHMRFRAAPDPASKSSRKVLARWASAFALHLKGMSDGPWHRFAANRIVEVFGDKPKATTNVAVRAPVRDTLVSLMETTTGVLALQEALQQDRPLLILANKEPRTVPIAKLTPPASAAHPWDEMLRKLSKAVPDEPLAAAVPAAFWYLRAGTIAEVFRLSDEVDRFGTPAARLASADALDRGLIERYATELGLTRSSVERGLAQDVVGAVALAGSDPYLREGTDLTAVLRVKQPAPLDAFLAASLAAAEKAHGAIRRDVAQYQGVALSSARSADGAVHQWHARVGELDVLSNSEGAIQRVLDAHAGRSPRLADEKDFRFMLARDGDPGPGTFAFFGDRFVGEVVGPRQKVLEARRQLAAAELMTPGFAALLYGLVYGRSPASTGELVASRLLRKSELAHASGSSIAWQPGVTARSSWGTPSALTPLIDLPAAERTSESERVAYDRFARTYESYWSTYIDPTAIRLRSAAPGPSAAPAWSADVRVLPLIEGSDYNEVRELAGQARVSVPNLAGDGLRAVVGIGPTAGVRRELGQLAGGVGRGHGLTIDFLGDWAMAGVADRARLTSIVKNVAPALPQPPHAAPAVDEVAQIARAPLYAAVGIRSASGAALALSALRLAAKDALGGMVVWGEVPAERGVSVVRVTVRPPGADSTRPEVAVFYALTSDVLLISLDEAVLRGLVDDALDGRGPKPAPVSEGGAQLVVDLAASPEGGLLTVASWFLTEEMMRHAEPGRALAEALLRGAPEHAGSPSEMRALAFAYFGGAPLPPHGGAYTIGNEGVEDPAHGSRATPRWPRLPVAGSPVEQLVRALGAFHAEVQLDDEGQDPRSGRAMQSLHVKSALGAPLSAPR